MEVFQGSPTGPHYPHTAQLSKWGEGGTVDGLKVHKMDIVPGKDKVLSSGLSNQLIVQQQTARQETFTLCKSFFGINVSAWVTSH